MKKRLGSWKKARAEPPIIGMTPPAKMRRLYVLRLSLRKLYRAPSKRTGPHSGGSREF
jgi:hypothetical protein